jgi:hypothetical protein
MCANTNVMANMGNSNRKVLSVSISHEVRIMGHIRWYRKNWKAHAEIMSL